MDNRKIVIFGYIFFAAVVWYLSRGGFHTLFVMSSTVRRVPNIQLIREATPIVLAALTFIILFFNKRSNDFFDEVVAELKKVTWPSREDVVKSTVVVLGCVLFASCVLAVFDIAFGKLVGFLLRS
ncbi:preprotein translocase subunit SecE [bacterium]|nr:preprotein translocase subunit SecE [bacterium]